MSHIIVGTAGHIDHGKTALVKALTGIDADRLKEEKERGITIDIGFANLRLPDGTTIGFIDVPGHERFVKNMLAGVGGIDAVMLVIAADESVMPQTREHLDICSLLHIKRGLTVLTKVDTTDPELVDLAEVEVHEFLKGSFLDGAPVLRVSSVTGEGIPALIAALEAIVREVPGRDDSQVFRLPIDRCFTMKGFGTVVAGTLIAGHIRRDDEIEILPDRRSARVRGIQVHGASVDEAHAGQRTALNLQRLDLGEVERGMVLTAPGVFTPSAAFDVQVELLPSAPGPIVRRKRIRFHIGTAELMGYVVLLGQDAVEPGGSAFAQVLLERPTFALPGDRFIIRQYSPMVTLGGGEILDSRPGRHRRSDPAIPQRLQRLQRSPLNARIAALVEGANLRAMDADELIGRLGLGREQVDAALDALVREGALREVADKPRALVASAVFDGAVDVLLADVRRFHESDPVARGIGREDLKARALRGASPLVFRAALDHLVHQQQLTVDQDVVHVHGRVVTLKEDDARMRSALEERFRSLGLQAPSADEVIRDLAMERTPARKILQLLVVDQVVAKVAEDMFVDSAALRKLIADVRALKQNQSRLGVREFKELTGLSRKFAVPLLEYLDAQRITRRVGDERVIL
jgi:selenocysteine-specific elongation factor